MNDASPTGSGSRSMSGFAAAVLAVCVIAGVVALELLLFPSLRFWNKPVDELQQGIEAYRKLNYDGAIRHFSEAIVRRPTSDIAYNWRGMTYQSKGEPNKALADYDTAIRFNPTSAGLYYNRAMVHQAGREYAAAVADYEEAIRINPAYAMAYNNRGNVRRATGDLDQAISDYTAAIRLDRTNAHLLGNRATAYRVQGDIARAIEDYESAIKLNPKEDAAFNNLAWLWSTCPQPAYRDGRRAIEYAMKACELRQWKDAASVDTLAAAHAEAGEFEGAVKWESKCLEMGNMSESDTAGAKDRLELYQAGKPYHSEK